MKILYVGSFAEPWSTETYIAGALDRAGHSVRRLEESTADQAGIVAQAAELKPDVLLGAKWRFREANIGWPEAAAPVERLFAAARPHVGAVVTWLFDLLAPDFALAPGRFEWARRVAEACDVFATTDGATAPRLANSVVLRQGAPDDVDPSATWKPAEYAGDVLFLGRACGERAALLEVCGKTFRQRFRVVNDCHGAKLTKLVRSYRVVVGPAYPFYPGYWSNRLYVVTGHGGLFAAPAVPGMQSDGWEAWVNYLPLPRDAARAAAKLRELVERYDGGQLETIRRQGCEHAARRCSYERRVAELLASQGFRVQGSGFRRGALPEP